MAGHSKWKNIKIRKGRQDAQKGKMFTKLAREILIAARQGGPDPDANYRLKDTIVRARDASMPSSNIDRLLEKARGDGDSSNLEEIVYEGYGPAGVAVLVEITTDNRNRTAADMRLRFSKNQGSLGESGCVAWLFERRGEIRVEAKGLSEDDFMLQALDLGAVDVEANEDEFLAYSEASELHQVRTAFSNAKFNVKGARLTYVPKTTTAVGAADAPAVLHLLEVLEDHDDVMNVYANFDIPAEVWEALES